LNINSHSFLRYGKPWFYNNDGTVVEIKTIAAMDSDIHPGFGADSFSLSIFIKD